MASANFTVNGSSVPPELAVSASSTVTLALLSTTGVNTVTWSIIGNHAESAVNPTITPAGTPSGATATFPMPSGAGQAYIVQCQINGGVDAEGVIQSSYTKTALVGVVSAGGAVPFAFGESFERSATHGYTEALNGVVNSGGSVLTAAEAYTDAAFTAHLASFFGSGSDGNLTASSGTTTLSKPTYYDTVTLTGTAQIDTAGYPLYIKTFNAQNAPARAIFRKGGDAVAASTSGGTVVDTISLGGGGAASQGGGGGTVNTNGTTAGSYPSTLAIGNGGTGGGGGTGGTSSAGKTGGAGRAGTFPTARRPQQGLERMPVIPTNTAGTTFQVICGGQGGGGGGGGGGSALNSGVSGGGGGSGGAVLEVWIGTLITGASTPAALIDSYGGAGSTIGGGAANGSAGGAGGGGGGGGVARIFIGKRTGSAIANLVCARGGAGGSGGPGEGAGTAGGGGMAGGGGEVLAIVLTTGSVQYQARESAGVAAVGATGGVPTVWGVTI